MTRPTPFVQISKSMLVRIAAVAVFANILLAQDYNRNAPKAIPSPAATSDSGKSTLPATQGDNTVIVPALKALAFLSSASGLSQSATSASGLSFSNLPLLQHPDFQRQMNAYLGRPLTLKQLNDITRAVIACYRAHHHPLVNVVVPEQDVQSGAVQILVTEYRVGEIHSEGNKWFSSKSVTAPISLQPGDTVDSRSLLSSLDAINANPFRRVDLVYTPSAQSGYTDLVLQTQDRLPLRVYSGVDNSGTPITGRDRWSMGVNWGNALWHDQQISYQFSSSTNFYTGRSAAPGEPSGASFVGHSLNWIIPVSTQNSINIFGVYERSIPNIGPDLGLLGRSGQASIRFVHTLRRTDRFTHSLQAGYDFKTTNNNLDFGGSSVSRNATEVDQFPLAYTATLMDRLGVTSNTATVVLSPGGMTPNNSDAAFQPAAEQSGRPFAQSNYVYWRNDLARLSKLPLGYTWSTRLTTQVSSASLLSTEQLAAGGSDLLRGYEPYSLIGDQGVILSNELRTRSFGPRSAETPLSTLLGQTQLLGFWDYASLHNEHATANVTPGVNGSSVGVGLRYGLRSYASLRFDYGWQLQRLPGLTGKGELASFSLVLGN